LAVFTLRHALRYQLAYSLIHATEAKLVSISLTAIVFYEDHFCALLVHETDVTNY